MRTPSFSLPCASHRTHYALYKVFIGLCQTRAAFFCRKTIKIRIEELAFYACARVFKAQMTMASTATLCLPHIHIPLCLTHSFPHVFACSISHPLRHANTHTHIQTNTHTHRPVLTSTRAHAPLQHLRACTLHFRRHIIHRPRG